MHCIQMLIARRNSLLKILSLLLVNILTGCAGLNDATKNIKDATSNIQKGAEALAKGMDQLDPIALKKILNENSDLRMQLQTVSEKLAGGFQGQGIVEINTRDVRVRIARYTGNQRITAWVDTRENWFWQELRLNDKDQELNFSASHALSHWHEAANSDSHTAVDNYIFMADKEAKEAFDTFLRIAPLIPGPEVQPVDLNSQFGKGGRHTINFEITPVAADRNGRWSTRIQIFLVKPQNQEEIVKEFDLDSDLLKNHPMGTPLPVTVALLEIRAQPPSQ